MVKPTEQIYDCLRENKIAYMRYEHEAILTVKDGRNIADRLGIIPCKCLLLVNRQHQHYMLILKGDKSVSLADLAKRIGSSRLSLASSEALETLLLTIPGAVSPLGLIFDAGNLIGLYIDEDIVKMAHLAFHPCVNTESVIIRTEDFLNIFLPVIHHSDYTIMKV